MRESEMSREREEGKMRRGRKTNSERLRKERGIITGSMGDISKIWKRKREQMDEGGRGKSVSKEQDAGEVAVRSEKGEEGGAMGKIEELIREMKEEVREGRKEMKVLGTGLTEVRQLRDELEKGEERWRKKKKEIWEKIKKIEERIESVGEQRERYEGIEKRLQELEREREGKREDGVREDTETEKRMREVERKMERQEKGERRKNIIIKKTRPGKELPKEKVRQALKLIGLQGEVEGVRTAGKWEEGKEGVLIVRMSSLEEKREVMRVKSELKV